jgi:hypothetical protein
VAFCVWLLSLNSFSRLIQDVVCISIPLCGWKIFHWIFYIIYIYIYMYIHLIYCCTISLSILICKYFLPLFGLYSIFFYIFLLFIYSLFGLFLPLFYLLDDILYNTNIFKSFSEALLYGLLPVVTCTFSILSKKPWLNLRSWSITPSFSPKSFMFLTSYL